MREVCKECPIKPVCEDLDYFMTDTFFKTIMNNFKPNADVLAAHSRLMEKLPEYEQLISDNGRQVIDCANANPEDCLIGAQSHQFVSASFVGPDTV